MMEKYAVTCDCKKTGQTRTDALIKTAEGHFICGTCGMSVHSEGERSENDGTSEE